MDEILRYLKSTYHPHAIILYGSYANGTNGVSSDFDALLITSEKHPAHDESIIEGVKLDVFIYASSDFDKEIAYQDFVTVYDGKILLDERGMAQRLIADVRRHIDNQPPKTRDELRTQLAWCEKMLARTSRGDAEGYFRWHWLLVDSLEIFFELCHTPYWGPKKALLAMPKLDPIAAKKYQAALEAMDASALEEWVGYIRKCFESKE